MQTIVITGVTSGIGLAAARILMAQGFQVLGVGHSKANCEHAAAQLLSEFPDGKCAWFTADLMQQREVNRVADELAAYLNESCGGELHALINNAGCVRSWYTTTEEGYEQQFALNYLAGFLLTQRLLPYLRKGRGRVLMTGSESHKGIRVHWNDVMLTRRYNPLSAYKQSKLCEILFAKGLNDRALGVRAYAVDPGLVNTDIGNKQTGNLVNFIWARRKKYGVLPEVPARTYAFLCMNDPAPEGLYYHLSRENKFSRQVTSENADKLFALSERLCGVQYPSGIRAADKIELGKGRLKTV